MPAIKNTHEFTSINSSAFDSQLTVLNGVLESRRDLFFNSNLTHEARMRLIQADPVLSKAFEIFTNLYPWFGDL